MSGILGAMVSEIMDGSGSPPRQGGSRDESGGHRVKVCLKTASKGRVYAVGTHWCVKECSAEMTWRVMAETGVVKSVRVLMVDLCPTRRLEGEVWMELKKHNTFGWYQVRPRAPVSCRLVRAR